MKKFLVAFLISLPLVAQEQLTTGPENGSLIIAGGNHMGEEIVSKFVALAGGKNANIVVIPTASGAKQFDEDKGFIKQRRQAMAIGRCLRWY